MRQCKLCNKEITENSIKVKGGIICKHCFDPLPISIKNSISSFTPKQIEQFKKLAKPYKSAAKAWKRCGDFRLCLDSIVLNGIEYPLRNLRDVRYNFHPKEVGPNDNTAIGIVTVVIESKSPHFLIEEEFLKGTIKARYIISGMDITYHYTREMEDAMREIQEAISSETYVIKGAKKELERIRREAQEKKRKEEQERRQKQQKQADDRKRAQQGSSSTARETPLEAALRLLGMKQPFTQDELHKRRNQILRETNVHPDNGGTGEEFKRIQEAYELLQKFATN